MKGSVVFCNDCRNPVDVDSAVAFVWTDEKYPQVKVATWICPSCKTKRTTAPPVDAGTEQPILIQ